MSTASGHAPNETTDGVLGDLLPHQGITELLERLRCNLGASDGPECNGPEVICWIYVRRLFSDINSFILQELPANHGHMRQGIVVWRYIHGWMHSYTATDLHWPTNKLAVQTDVTGNIMFICTEWWTCQFWYSTANARIPVPVSEHRAHSSMLGPRSTLTKSVSDCLLRDFYIVS